MSSARSAATFVLLFLAAPLGAHHGANGLAIRCQMLSQDNPGELSVECGERLFYAKRGPKQTSLEQCDLGKVRAK